MELDKQVSGTIFDIQGFSVHDGPGARTLIFLKGCSLNCFWCSNPEGISKSNIPLYYSSKCIGCGNCKTACPNNAIQFIDEKPVIDRDFCEICNDHTCIDNCYTDTLRMSGRTISVDELFSIIQRDRQYWGNKGGITLTGGEPLIQVDFARDILEKCYNSYIHTAIETCGNVPWKNFEMVIDYLDWIFFDLKHLDTDIHKKGTGVSNRLILENAERIASKGNYRLIFRMAIIPGYNDSIENITATAEFMRKIGVDEINILPIHHFGSSKYELLGMKYTYGDVKPPDMRKMEEIKNIFDSYAIKCYIGSNTPF